MNSGDLKTYKCVKIWKSNVLTITILSLHSICSESKKGLTRGCKDGVVHKPIVIMLKSRAVSAWHPPSLASCNCLGVDLSRKIVDASAPQREPVFTKSWSTPTSRPQVMAKNTTRTIILANKLCSHLSFSGFLSTVRCVFAWVGVKSRLYVDI